MEDQKCGIASCSLCIWGHQLGELTVIGEGLGTGMLFCYSQVTIYCCFVHLFILSFIFAVDGMARILMLLKNSLQVSARLQD